MLYSLSAPTRVAFKRQKPLNFNHQISHKNSLCSVVLLIKSSTNVDGKLDRKKLKIQHDSNAGDSHVATLSAEVSRCQRRFWALPDIGAAC